MPKLSNCGVKKETNCRRLKGISRMSILTFRSRLENDALEIFTLKKLHKFFGKYFWI